LAEKFRGDPRLANIRYVLGDIDYRNLITSPREVFRFSPTGEVIRAEVPEPIGPAADRIARASRVRPTPEPEAGPQTLPLNFERAAQVPSWEPIHPQAETVAPLSPVTETPEGVLPGMAEHIAEQNRGAAQVRGEELTRQMNVPENIEGAAGRMETLSPLWRGKGPQGELLPPLSTAPVAEAPPEVRPFEKPTEMPEPAKEEEPKEAEIKGVTKSWKKPAGAKREAPPNIERIYTRDEIELAERSLEQEAGMMLSADRPGIYFAEQETPDVQGRTPKGKSSRFGNIYGVKSLRNQMPILKNHPEWGAERVTKALRNKDSADYKRMIDAAVKYNRGFEERERAAIQGESEGEGPIPNFEPPKE